MQNPKGLLSGYLPAPAMQQVFAAPAVDPTLPWKQPGYSQAYTPQQFTPSKADKKLALYKGLGAMGPALIAGGGPQLTPGGGADAIAQAGTLFNNAFDGHLQGVKNDKFQEYQMGRQQNMDRMAGEQHTAQMGQFKQAAQQQQAAQQWANSLSPDHPLYRLARVNPEAAYQAGLKQATTSSKPTSRIEEYQFAKQQGFMGTFNDFVKSTRGGTNVNVNTGTTGGLQQELWNVDAANIAERRQNALQLNRTVSDLDQMGSLLDAGVKTGFGQETLGQLKSLANTAGIDVDTTGLAGQEAFAAISNRMVLPLVKQLGVNPTDADLKFVVNATPSLGKTVEGNRLIIETMKRNAAREAQLADLQYRYARENNGLQGWGAVEANFYQENPLFNQQERQTMQGLVQAASGGSGSSLKRYQPQTGGTVQDLGNGRKRWIPGGDIDQNPSPVGDF
ncbi:MAG: hypothetical protein RIM72_22365 [Alphaproteobacteria bacterium]